MNSKSLRIIVPAGGCLLFLSNVLAHVLGVHDPVRVALLGQEPLALSGEILVQRVPRYQGVEPGRTAVLLGTKEASQPLGLFLP